MRIVCDTNVLISALIFPGGLPDQVVNLARLKEVALCLSPDILTEFKKVLTVKFKYSDEEAGEFSERLIVMAELTYPKERVQRIRRKDSDNRILECALESRADFLISGDKKDLLPLERIGTTRIVTSRQFLQIWRDREDR